MNRTILEGLLRLDRLNFEKICFEQVMGIIKRIWTAKDYGIEFSLRSVPGNLYFRKTHGSYAFESLVTCIMSNFGSNISQYYYLSGWGQVKSISQCLLDIRILESMFQSIMQAHQIVFSQDYTTHIIMTHEEMFYALRREMTIASDEIATITARKQIPLGLLMNVGMIERMQPFNWPEMYLDDTHMDHLIEFSEHAVELEPPKCVMKIPPNLRRSSRHNSCQK